LEKLNVYWLESPLRRYEFDALAELNRPVEILSPVARIIWPNGPWIEILHDPSIAAYTHGFAVMENAPLVDQEGDLSLPQSPGLGVAINKAC
jgi:L-alanine-DL-glutamate epimerase-like enolase superfamily enzyme